MLSDNSVIQRPQRWDMPFWQERCDPHKVVPMTEAEVDRLKQQPLFRQMDPARFADHTPLDGLLLNDTRIRRFKTGDIVVREGDYGHSAFLILSGSIRVMVEKLDESLAGHARPKSKSFFGALSQLWRNPSNSEVRRLLPSQQARAASQGQSRHRGDTTIFLQDVSAIIRDKRTAVIKAGELFGEIAALGRTPRTSTVFSDGDSELLEIRWQGLRELRLRSPELKEYIDRIYRERSLKTHLRETPLFAELSDADLEQVAAVTEFQTYGSFDWHASYKKLTEMTPAERLAFEPIVAREGNYANGIYLVRSGFARLSEIYNHGERTVSYLGRGQMFGFDEIAHGWRTKTPVPFQRTLRAVGHIDLLFVPTHVVEEFVLPRLKDSELPPLPTADRRARLFSGDEQAASKIGPEMLEFLVEKRFINGTATMIVDLYSCTRCDDCVRACAATHENNPRFIRNGPVQGRFMIANACMHCIDPVCMIGCPTGAIHRESAHGEVIINDLTCIGCATCANSCPYDNIQMVFPRDPDGTPYYDEATHQPIQKAAKCDLCVGQLTGPACVNACPHEAMIRVDMRDLDTLSEWFSK